MQVHDLDAVPERIDEVAAKRRHQFDSIFGRQLLPHFGELRFVANDEPEVARSVRLSFVELRTSPKTGVRRF